MLLKAAAAFAALLLLVVVLFLVGVPLPGDVARAPLERLLTSVFGVPTRIEGQLRLRTGLVASAEADVLVLKDKLDPEGPPLARATRSSVRIDVIALLRGSVALREVSGDHMEIRLARGADGRGNWEPLFATSAAPAPVSFAGIGFLKISKLNGSYVSRPGEAPKRWQLDGLESSLMGGDPITARGTLSIAGRTLGIDASSASLVELVEGPGKAIPIKAEIKASGTQVSVNGTYAMTARTLEASFQVKAEDGDAALNAAGAAAHQSGPLDAHGKFRLSANDAAINDLVFRLGKTSASGSVRVDWARNRPLISLDLSGERVDTTPFVAGAGRERGKTPSEGAVQVIHDVTTAIDLDAKVSVAQFVRLVAVMRDYSLEARIRDNVLSSRSSARFLGMKTSITTDYSASGPRRVLAIRVEGSRFSTENLPDTMRSGAVAATVGALRGELHGSGMNTQEVVGSARVNLDMRDLRFSWSRTVKRPTVMRLETARIDIAKGGGARGRIQGRLDGRPCSANVAGGTLPSLIAGERWPLRVTGACAGATLAAQGHIVVKPPKATGELDFTGRSDRIGPLAELLGLASGARQSAAVEGRLSIDESAVRAKLAEMNVGRTHGSGQVSWPLENTQRARINLALNLLDIDELSSLVAEAPEQNAKDPLAREVLPPKLELPDLDLDLSAEAARLKGESLRRVRVEARAREGGLPPAPFAFDWRNISVSGTFSTDLRSERPSVELSASARDIDLDKVLTDIDLAKAGLRAGTITLEAKAAGVRLGELLSRATVDAAINDGKIADIRPFLPGLAGSGEFSAALKVAEGKPATLTMRGEAGGMPFDAAIETGRLTELARAEKLLPATLRLTLGENRLQASGTAGFEGTANFRATLSGKRLDALGRIAGARFPFSAPYLFSAVLDIAPDSIRVSDLDAKLGKSQFVGTFNLKLDSDRPFHFAELRAPELHFEDLALHVLVGGGEKSPTNEAASEAKEAQRIAQVKSVLSAFDAQLSLDVDALHSEGKPYAKLKGGLTLKSGDLYVSLRDVEVAGGTATADFSFDASQPRPRLRWRALAKGFEYGPLAKAFDPRSALEGVADLSFDITTGRLLAPLLADANGQFNAAVYPRGQGLGAAQYWGTGLFYFVQRKIDPGSESRLNCVVGLLDIKDGLARSEALFADTTRVRIIGNVEARLGTGALSGNLTPRAKNPGIFRVDPSVDISGTLESPQVTVAPVSLLTTPLYFILPLYSFAYSWLNTTNAPADGSEGCREAFERAVSADKTKPEPPSRIFPRIWPF